VAQQQTQASAVIGPATVAPIPTWATDFRFWPRW